MTAILLFGATGGIGRAIFDECLRRFDALTMVCPCRVDATPLNWHPREGLTVLTPAWDPDDESSYHAIAQDLAANHHEFTLCLSAIGALHTDEFQPEKKISRMTMSQLMWSHRINAVYPAMIMKYFLPTMSKHQPATMAMLSARVGSISDNRLGGWVSYRSAKAALNMIIKTVSIECRRTQPNVSVIGIHPGTVDTALSEPFQANIRPNSLATPQQCAMHIFDHILADMSPQKSGRIWAWDGTEVLP